MSLFLLNSANICRINKCMDGGRKREVGFKECPFYGLDPIAPSKTLRRKKGAGQSTVCLGGTGGLPPPACKLPFSSPSCMAGPPFPPSPQREEQLFIQDNPCKSTHYFNNSSQSPSPYCPAGGKELRTGLCGRAAPGGLWEMQTPGSAQACSVRVCGCTRSLMTGVKV